MAALLPRFAVRIPRSRNRISWKTVLSIASCLWFYYKLYATGAPSYNSSSFDRHEYTPQITVQRDYPTQNDLQETDVKRRMSSSSNGQSLQTPLNVGQTSLQLPSFPDSPTWSKAFPDYNEYATLVSKAATLPDLIVVPFELAVEKDILKGWEYEWISNATYNIDKWGPLQEPKIDFIYTWVNGSQQEFHDTKRPYEENSTLNDINGEWLDRHGSNRYRDWNEFRFSLRSIEANAPFRNRVQVLVNAVIDTTLDSPSKQIPGWLNPKATESGSIQVLSQEDFFESEKQGCLPSFNSLTIENQLHNTPSEVDMAFALSDDMLLGKPHAASDIFSPLFGPMIGFKTNSYNTMSAPTDADAQRFGEKPWLIYTSWLLNRRFGSRKRKGMAHFGHAISRRVMAEAMQSFPGPELQSACSRFRGDFRFQLYSWYVTFHYTLERHREVLLWSYLMVRADLDGDGYLSWAERRIVIQEILEGHENEETSSFRMRNFYQLPDALEDAGLEPPAVNFDILWTSLDGPVMIKDLDCIDFNIDECLAPGFSIHLEEDATKNPAFSTAAIFDRAARQNPKCGDCLIKILLHRVRKGLWPLMPNPETQQKEHEIVTKALQRYQYVVHDPDGLFVMVTDTEQVETTLIKRFKKKDRWVGQLCLNDDVLTEDEEELQELQQALNDMYMGLFPAPSSFETAERGAW